MTNSRLGIYILLATCIAFASSPLSAEDSSDIINMKKFGLKWEPALPERIILLRVWYTLDGGQTWKIYSESENPSSPAPVKVKEDGVYGLYTQSKDVAGLEEPAPTPGTKPKKLVIVDTIKPALVLVSPNNAEVFPTAQDMRIEWNSDDVNFPPAPVSLYYSIDGGGSWSVIKKEIQNTGSYSWKLPAESSQLYKVKIVAVDRAGNSSEDVSDNNFTVDGKAPVSRITGPSEAKSPNFDVAYNVRDIGGAGVAKVVLYFQLGNAKEWHVYGDDRDLTSPIHFEAKQGGKFGFKLVSTDRVGNSEASPDANTVPDLWCLMDAKSPEVQLTSFKGANIPDAGSDTSRMITWTATDDNMADQPITLEYSVNDGTQWTVIVSSFKNSGQYPWKVPSRIDAAKSRLRITALDVLGNKSMDVSDPFRMDGTPPDTKILSIVPISDDMPETPDVNLAPQVPPTPKPLGLDDLMARAEDALAINDLSEVQSLIGQALALDGNYYKAHYLQGRVHFDNRRLNDAIQSYSAAIKQNPGHQESHISLGFCYQTLGEKSLQGEDSEQTKANFRKAALEYEEATKIVPDNYEEYYGLGLMYARLRNYAEAITQFKKAVTLSPDNGNAHWYLGQIYERQGDITKAIEGYGAAMKAYQPGSLFQQKAEAKIRELKDRK